MKTNEVYLRHILEAVEQVERYVAGVGREEFLDDSMRQDAVVRQLEIVGEASRQLPDTFRETHSDVPWSAMIGMRNRLAHDYLNVDLDIVWDVVHHDLPVLKQQIRSILDE